MDYEQTIGKEEVNQSFYNVDVKDSLRCGASGPGHKAISDGESRPLSMRLTTQE